MSEFNERYGHVTFNGAPVTLIGPALKVGDKAPDFKVLNSNLEEETLDTTRGKIRLIVSVPSLDTPVCDTETRRFNKEATSFSPDVEVIVISMDLPFAQKRWCAAAGIDRVRALSDHREASFGKNWGVLIKELRLLARAVFVVDKDDIIRYVEYVKEITQEPDYDAALSVVKSLNALQN
ncbi:thiol peroxidase, atypical 2-Cys peroxiredoxin [Caldanaerobius fijiensis DSM 17918]|uniref:Thiol peroxidase n=1 Tax=Caldanaerobius fijiensis DSM 17918 TaxID=1121256 RepID=A0A1M5BQR1_9THEO|nr:thiol peroxidase [Caldanaerobius fijiensis]SHF44710.1 thiol peroxidase, atypical 2-Cys peroxiredoxin [Caldanaerobius fijiensis DSM 17918]